MGNKCSVCDCSLNGIDVESVTAIGAHLDGQMLAGFHLPTIWKIALIFIALHLVAFGVFKWHRARQARRRARRDMADQQRQEWGYWVGGIRRSLRRASGRHFGRPGHEEGPAPDVRMAPLQAGAQPPPAQQLPEIPTKGPPESADRPKYGYKESHH